MASGKGKFSADMGTSQEVRIGDLVFCLFDVPETPRTVGLSRHIGMITGAYTIFECSDPPVASFLDLFYRAMDDRKLLSPLYSGLRNTIPPSTLLGVKTPMPPAAEQAAIVRFLDHADRKIRKYIRAKQNLVRLLEEHKQAIIHHAVTRGIDPSVRLKPSGIEWVGDVPEQWAIVLNQRILKEKVRPYDGTAETQLSLSQRDGLIATNTMKERSLQTSSFDNWKVTVPGDLVLNRFKAHLGVFFASTLRGIVSFHYGVFTPRVPLISKYYELLFHTNPYRAIFAGRSNGMTVGLQNLSNQNFYNVRSPVPPIGEQAAIVEFCGSATASLEKTIRKARQEVALLRELGIRLVADVVTGKLDVREVAEALPDESTEALEDPELEPEDAEIGDANEPEAEEAEE